MTIQFQENVASETGERERRRLLSLSGEPLFFADWLNTVFIHYEVPAETLQRDVPFELDLCDGKAYVSLVAFSMRRLRPRVGGRVGAWLVRPIASNDYLNVRTYVRHRGEAGIYFLAEWLNNRWSVPLGRWPFGLPYHFGKIDYRNSIRARSLNGCVTGAGGGKFSYRAEFRTGTDLRSCAAGSLDEFLLERYTAFTACDGIRRFFRIWHPAWLQAPVDVVAAEPQLLTMRWPWFAGARLTGGHYSPGVRNVWMGRPHRVAKLPKRSVLSSFYELP